MDPRRLLILGIVAVISAIIGFAAWWQKPVPPPAPSAVTPPLSSDVAPGTPAAASQAQKAAPPPSFDIARVEPDGTAVIAGRAAPGSDVELLANGGVVDHTKANEVGEFVLSPPPFAPGNYELTLRSGGLTSLKSITVSVPFPGKGGGDLLVVAGEPGKPSEVVAAGPATPAPRAPVAAAADLGAPPQQPSSSTSDTLQIAAVETEGGRLFVQGTGPQGVWVIIYLNNQAIADAVVGADKKWSLTVEHGLDPGSYAVRVDQVEQGGKVIARAEVPFSSGASKPPAATSESAPQVAATEKAAEGLNRTGSPAPAPSSAGEADNTGTSLQGVPEQSTAIVEPNAANAVVKALDTLKVQRGDNLWRISRRTYGRGIRYSTIYQANTGQIRNPNRIYPGQIFVMPPKS
jgi:nucleoid-associated protein YgaU